MVDSNFRGAVAGFGGCRDLGDFVVVKQMGCHCRPAPLSAFSWIYAPGTAFEVSLSKVGLCGFRASHKSEVASH